jgi:hypothetical protein
MAMKARPFSSPMSWMVQMLGCFGFAPKAFESLTVVGEIVRKKF